MLSEPLPRYGLPLRDRLAKHIEIGEDDCIVWTGSKQRGYGSIKPPTGRSQRAHRLVWEEFVGPIPDGMVLDHLCRNHSCVNPDHLEPVTQAENIRRGLSPTATNALKTHCCRGHEFTPENTYVWRNARICRTCRKEYQAR